jgi:hypothetical protein
MSMQSDIIKALKEEVLDTNAVAKTIFKQLGGARFAFMTGAKATLNGDTLMLRLNGRMKNGKTVNRVFITYDRGMDLYTMKFGRYRKLQIKWLKTLDGLYNDMLVRAFERNTGLYTKL